MKPYIVLFAGALVASVLPASAQTAPTGGANLAKFYASASEVETLIAKATAEHKGDNTLTAQRLVALGPYHAMLEYRTGTTPPTVHPGQAELLYVIQGGCTFLVGGTLEGRKDAAPGASTVYGTDIQGATSSKIAKGDYILVPPDTAHQFTAIDSPFITLSLHLPMPK